MSEWEVVIQPDKPKSGMWHCGPNAAWVTVTHKPTMISARAYGMPTHKLRQAAQDCCELMMELARGEKCRFPERLQSP